MQKRSELRKGQKVKAVESTAHCFKTGQIIEFINYDDGYDFNAYSFKGNDPDHKDRVITQTLVDGEFSLYTL
jgi:hypothetical protein